MAILFQSLPEQHQENVEALFTLMKISDDKTVNGQLLKGAMDAISWLLINATLDNERKD